MVNENIMVVDASNALVGRLATRVAKEALHGKTIRIINCEKAAISGKKREIITDWQRKFAMGTPRKGPFVHRVPDKFVRRMIRGMLPYKQPRGREAFERILCYVGTPEDLKNIRPVELGNASVDKLPSVRFITIGELCKELGGKWYGQEN